MRTWHSWAALVSLLVTAGVGLGCSDDDAPPGPVSTGGSAGSSSSGGAGGTGGGTAGFGGAGGSAGAGGAAPTPTKFVDPNHPQASDSNDGSEDAPWATLTHASTAAVPGDVVAVRAHTYTEGLHVGVSGTPGARVVYMAHPDDVGTVVLDGRCIRIEGQSHVEIRSFRVQNCDDVGDHDSAGIAVLGIEGGPQIEDILILNNHTHRTYSSGISVWGVRWQHDPGDFERITDVVVGGNLIEYANDGGYNEQITFAYGVINFEIHHNELRNQDNSLNGGEGIDIKEGCAFGSIHHNYIHHIERRGIYIDGGGRSVYSSPTHDIDVYANVVHDAPNGFAIMSEGGEDVSNVRVYNNLFHHISSDGAFIYDHPDAAADPGQFSNIEFVNNTFWDCDRNGLDFNSQQVTGLYAGNNILSTYLDRFDLASEEANTEGGDPGFVGTGDYHLAPGSPAVDTGSASRAPSVDIEDQPRPQGGGYDRGAYER